MNNSKSCVFTTNIADDLDCDLKGDFDFNGFPRKRCPEYPCQRYKDIVESIRQEEAKRPKPVELSQEQIKFDNLKSRSISGPWYKKDRTNRSGTIGEIIHWIYVYRGLDLSEQVCIGSGKVTYAGKLIATYTTDKDLDMPVFIFTEEYKDMQDNQDLLIKGFKEGRKTSTGMVERIETKDKL
jgi:hypothetical protein